MIEQTKSNLQSVLDNVLQSSAQLKAQVASVPAQIDQLREQVFAGERQLRMFESLIASLQVAVNDEKLLESIAVQESANATISPPSPAGAPVEAPAGFAGEPAQAPAEVVA